MEGVFLGYVFFKPRDAKFNVVSGSLMSSCDYYETNLRLDSFLVVAWFVSGDFESGSCCASC